MTSCTRCAKPETATASSSGSRPRWSHPLEGHPITFCVGNCLVYSKFPTQNHVLLS
jgi:hypothetical protein